MGFILSFTFVSPCLHHKPKARVATTPIILCCWHVFKAWCLRGIEKIKDVDVWDAIFQDLHDVMYMSINHGETIENFKEHGRVALKKNLHKHRPSDAWTNYFWIYYHQFGK
jgi:hypothetical protein